MVPVSQDEIESIAIRETLSGCSLVVEALKYLSVFFLLSVEEFFHPTTHPLAATWIDVTASGFQYALTLI